MKQLRSYKFKNAKRKLTKLLDTKQRSFQQDRLESLVFLAPKSCTTECLSSLEHLCKIDSSNKKLFEHIFESSKVFPFSSPELVRYCILVNSSNELKRNAFPKFLLSQIHENILKFSPEELLDLMPIANHLDKQDLQYGIQSALISQPNISPRIVSQMLDVSSFVDPVIQTKIMENWRAQDYLHLSNQVISKMFQTSKQFSFFEDLKPKFSKALERRDLSLETDFETLVGLPSPQVVDLLMHPKWDFSKVEIHLLGEFLDNFTLMSVNIHPNLLERISRFLTTQHLPLSESTMLLYLNSLKRIKIRDLHFMKRVCFEFENISSDKLVEIVELLLWFRIPPDHWINIVVSKHFCSLPLRSASRLFFVLRPFVNEEEVLTSVQQRISWNKILAKDFPFAIELFGANQQWMQRISQELFQRMKKPANGFSQAELSDTIFAFSKVGYENKKLGSLFVKVWKRIDFHDVPTSELAKVVDGLHTLTFEDLDFGMYMVQVLLQRVQKLESESH